MPEEIHEKDVIEQLVRFVRCDADLDGLAQMYSDYIHDDVVCVVDDQRKKSITYLHGSHKAAVEAQPVSELRLCPRSRKCLLHLGISTIGQLIQRTAKQLSECRNFGETSLTEIRGELRRLGFNLKDDS